MLIHATHNCSENCAHCFMDAKPGAPSMPLNIFRDSINFGISIGARVFLISGGEAILHPEFEEMCFCMESAPAKFVLLTSGMFAKSAELLKRAARFASMPNSLYIQVRSDARFYPNHKANRDAVARIIGEPRFFGKVAVMPDGLSSDAPIKLGRAASLDLPQPVKAPMCANPIIAAKQCASLFETVRALENAGKVCAPAIGINGEFYAGETRLCQSAGNIADGASKIYENIKNLKPCGHCGLGTSHLPEKVRLLLDF